MILRGGFFNTITGLKEICLEGEFEDDGRTIIRHRVAKGDFRIDLSWDTSSLLTREHISILRYIADQTNVFVYKDAEDDVVDQYRSMRQLIIEEGLKEIVEGTMTKEVFEQRLFSAKLAGF